jgi:protein gp37
MTKLKIHPTAARFPAIPAEEFAELVEDVRLHKLRYPIMLTADSTTIVDGINRARACEEAGVKPRYRNLPKHYSEADVIDYIIGANLRRRDLDRGRKAALIVDIEGDREYAAAKERLRQGQKQGGRGKKKTPRRDRRDGETRAKLAKKGNVSRSTINQAIAVKTYSPALYAKVHSGEITLNEAYKQVRRAKRANPAAQEQKSISKHFVTVVTHAGAMKDYPLPKGKPHFNITNDQVGWAKWTWNPVTGCLHNCPYCYAREGAVVNENLAKFYPFGFEPTFYEHRLSAPRNTVVPKEAETDPRWRRVFVSSMGDLFGKWVLDDWIDRVFASCINNPQWDYLFLTKFPQRYVGLTLPPTAWMGTTVDDQYRVKIAEEAFRKIEGVRLKWLSLEPLLAPLEFSDLSMFDWVVIGSQSATEQPGPVGHVPAFAPPFEWVARLTAQAHEAGCKVFHKANLLGIPNPQCAGMKLVQEAPVLRGVRPFEQMSLLPAAE